MHRAAVPARARRGLLRPLPAMDLPFLILVLTLVGFGLVMLYSASSAVALYRRGDAWAYVRPQLLYAAMGIGAMWAASRVDYHIYHKLAWPLLGLSMVLLTAVLSAQMSWAAGTEPPVDLDPAEEQTLLHVGREYRFYFTDAQGEIPDPEFWEGCTLEAELDEEEEREYTETFEVRADEAGRLYLAVELSPENSGLRTIRYKTAFENADGERWFAWNELKALFEPVDVQEEEIWIWYEEDCWPRDYDDDTVQYLNFTRQEVIFDPELEQVTLHFGNDAVYTVALGEERRFRLGCVTEPDQALRAALGDQAGEAEVVDFTGDPRFEAVGTLTLRSEKQYLYLWKDGVFTLLDSVWDGSTHTLQTAELGCYVLTDIPL